MREIPRVLRLPYRCLQRVMVLEAVAVLVAKSEDVISSIDSTNNVRALEAGELKEFIERNEAPHCEQLIGYLANERTACYGITEAEHLLSFAWVYHGSPPAEMNQGRHPATATSLQLENDAAFVFHAYTSPTSRGKQLLTKVLSQAAQSLYERNGVSSLVTTTEVVNDAARSAFRRSGFKEIGTYWRFGIGKWVRGRFPKPSSPINGYGG